MTTFKAIAFEDYVARHLEANNDEVEADFRKALREAVDAKRAGRRCECGSPIWAIGSAVAGAMCFTCITGEAHPSDDFEIDEALEPGERRTPTRAGDKPISRRSPCPCGSGRKYKKCCMPSEERMSRSPEASAPSRGRGPAAAMVEFSQPLIDAAGGNPTAHNNALQLGMIFWNLGAAAESGHDDLVREQLKALEDNCHTARMDPDGFRDITAMMLSRYARMRPASEPNLTKLLGELRDRDGLPQPPRPGIAGRIAGALTSRISLSKKGTSSDDAP